jgi:hypothetical protein
MDPISGADRLVLLLRQKLQERAKTIGSKGSSPKGKAGATEAPIQPRGVEALAATADVDERQLRRAFVQTLLADQLGAALVNDAKFQQVVSRVTDAIDDDPDTSRLLSRLLAEIRPS